MRACFWRCARSVVATRHELDIQDCNRVSVLGWVIERPSAPSGCLGEQAAQASPGLGAPCRALPPQLVVAANPLQEEKARPSEVTRVGEVASTAARERPTRDRAQVRAEGLL